MYKKLAIIIGVFLIISGVLGGVAYGMVYANDTNRLSYAIHKSFIKQDKTDMTTTIQYHLDDSYYEDFTKEELDPETKDLILFANQFLEKSAFQVHVSTNRDEKNILMSDIDYQISALYGDEDMLDFRMRIQDETLELSAESLMDQRFYVTLNEITDQAEVTLDKIDFEKYTEIINASKKRFEDVKIKPYIELYETFCEDGIEKEGTVTVELNEGKTVKCREYTLTFDMASIIEFADELIELAQDDSVLMEAYRLTFLEICNELYDSKDYRELKITSKEIREVIEILEDEEDFKDQYQEFFDALTEQFETMDDELLEDQSITEAMGDYQITIAIDKLNNVRKLSYANENGFINFSSEMIFNDVKEAVDPIEMEDENAIRLMEISEQNYDENKIIFDAVVESVGEHYKLNPVFDILMKDIEENIALLPLMYQEELKTAIDEVKKDKEALIDEFVEQIKTSY